MYSVAMVVALELAVGNPDLDLFTRFISWTALLMTWTSMRCDDAQHLDVESISLSAVGFRAVLVKTKTTGPDKRHRAISVFVSRRIGFTGVGWLGIGLWILGQTGYDFPREYLVMDQSVRTGVLRRAPMAPYRLALSIRSVLSPLEAPKKVGDRWTSQKGVALMPVGLQGFHTGHSPKSEISLDGGGCQRALRGTRALPDSWCSVSRSLQIR